MRHVQAVLAVGRQCPAEVMARGKEQVRVVQARVAGGANDGGDASGERGGSVVMEMEMKK